MKLTEESKITEALAAVVTAQERSERSLSFMDISGYQGTVTGDAIDGIVGQIGICVRELSEVVSILRESEESGMSAPPEKPEGDDLSEDALASYEAAAAHWWQEHMRIVHAVERCSVRVEAARAQGDVFFMDGIMDVREAAIPQEEEASLTDILLSLKDVYDAASEAAEVIRHCMARNI